LNQKADADFRLADKAYQTKPRAVRQCFEKIFEVVALLGHLYSTPTIELRRSSRIVSRQTPFIFPMRRRRPTSRKPHDWCNERLPVFSGNIPACKVQIPFCSDSSIRL